MPNFKLICMEDTYTDEQIYELLLFYEIENKNEFEEITNILKQYRPQVYKNLN